MTATEAMPCLMSNKRKTSPRANFPSRSHGNGADSAAAPKVPETTGSYPDFEFSGLTFRQQSVLHIIAVSHTVAQASRDSGVSEKTLRKWLDEPSFSRELDRLREEAYNLARKQFQALVPQLISVLAREAIENPDPSIRIRAARYALNYAVKFSDFDKLVDDVRDLQRVILEDQ